MIGYRARWWRLVAASLAVGGIGACASGGDNANTAHPDLPDELVGADWGYVGTVEDTNAFISVVRGADEAVVYLCDGEADIAEWFRGRPGTNGTLHLDNEAGASLVASPAEGGIVGTVTFSDGATHEFTTQKAEPGAGLFRVTDEDADRAGVQAGWIINNRGDQRGSLRVRGKQRTAPPLPDGPLPVSGVAYRVSVFYVPGPSKGPSSGVPIPYPNEGQVTVLWVTTVPPTTTPSG